MSYMPRSMLFFDGGAANGRSPDALYVLPGALLGLNIGLQFGSRLNNLIGVRLSSLLGGLCFGKFNKTNRQKTGGRIMKASPAGKQTEVPRSTSCGLLRKTNTPTFDDPFRPLE